MKVALWCKKRLYIIYVFYFIIYTPISPMSPISILLNLFGIYCTLHNVEIIEREYEWTQRGKLMTRPDFKFKTFIFPKNPLPMKTVITTLSTHHLDCQQSTYQRKLRGPGYKYWKIMKWVLV